MENLLDKLRPYRTFSEIKQPQSAFIFRCEADRDNNITCVLYQADGGAWKNKAIKTIKKFLTEKLKDKKNPSNCITCAGLEAPLF